MAKIPWEAIRWGAPRQTAGCESGRRSHVLPAALLLCLLALTLGACRLSASAGPNATSTPSVGQTPQDAPPVGALVIVAQ